MFKECPKCQGRMVTLADGYFCLTCGRTFALSSNPPAYGEDETPTQPSESEHLHNPIPNPGLEALDLTPSGPPQPIINHHAASHAQRRLQDDVARLEDTPELPSPLDPEHEIEAPDDPFVGLIATEETPLVAAPAHNTPSLPPDETSDNTPPEPTETDVSSIKPSAYVVHATQPLYTAPALTSTETSGLTAEQQLLADARELAAGAKRSNAPKNPAHAKADDLLAAAATPQKSSKRTRTWVLGALSVLILGGAVFGAWNMLKPSGTKVSPSPTPTVSPSPTATPSTEPIRRDSQRKSDLNTIAIGLEAYHKATGAYPVGSDISILTPLEKTTPPFITHINLDPSSNNETPIKYSYVSDGSSFTLSATLENGQDPDVKDGLYVVHNKNQ